MVREASILAGSSFPGLDDHLVEPEVTRDEIIGGRRVVAPPAEASEAIQHARINYLIRAHLAAGFCGASDLLTRFDEESDFATDTCVYKDGVDPATGGRHLEEIAFEVVSEQNERLVKEKARRMHRRGVRRIFTVWVKGDRRVCEWSPESQTWRPLFPDSRIEDPCLVAPLAVGALLDAAAADIAVVRALVAKDNPEIRKREAEAEARGELAGKADAILTILDARGIAVTEGKKREILSCQDLDRLNRWLRRTAVASSSDEITSEP